MAKVKCANCGEEMIQMYTKEGLKVLLCGHVKASNVKNVSGTLKQLEVYCAINIEGLNASFEKLATNSKLTIEELRAATNETVSKAKLLEQANLALMLGLPANELTVLFRSATRLGYATGITTEKAIESLCKGVGRRSRLILDNIGIAFKAKEAYDAYPDFDKNEAWQKYAITLIKEKASVLEA